MGAVLEMEFAIEILWTCFQVFIEKQFDREIRFNTWLQDNEKS